MSVVTRRSERARRSVRFRWVCSRAPVDRRRTTTLGVGRYGARTEDGSAVRACILFEVVQSGLRQSYAGIRSEDFKRHTRGCSGCQLGCFGKKAKKIFRHFSFFGKFISREEKCPFQIPDALGRGRRRLRALDNPGRVSRIPGRRVRAFDPRGYWPGIRRGTPRFPSVVNFISSP